jgi:predicted aspartyl protease
MMTLDSGAAGVQLPASFLLQLAKRGLITRDDYLGNVPLGDATGHTVNAPVFRVHDIVVGGKTVSDVTVVAGAEGIALLGQTFLKRLGTWAINNQSGELVILN